MNSDAIDVGRCDDCNEQCESLSGDPDHAMFCCVCVEATIPFQNTWAEDFCDWCKLRKGESHEINPVSQV